MISISRMIITKITEKKVEDRIFLFSFGLFYFVVTFFFFSFLSFPYRCNVEEDFKGRVTFLVVQGRDLGEER